eukprot:12005907-Alexandrium_andersonii.AAC.1
MQPIIDDGLQRCYRHKCHRGVLLAVVFVAELRPALPGVPRCVWMALEKCATRPASLGFACPLTPLRAG